MTLEIDFSQSHVLLKSAKIAKRLKEIKELKSPDFATYDPDIRRIRDDVMTYTSKNNVIVIGNGGSINNFIAFYVSLMEMTTKNVYIVSSMDPDYHAYLMSRCNPRDTVVIVVCKSGTNTCALECMLSFANYDMLIVTSKKGAMHEITKRKNITVIEHPDISGRFSALTESALVPAAMIGLPMEEIVSGMKAMNNLCAPGISLEKNPAVSLASALFLLEDKGYSEVFTGIYSMYMSGFCQIIKQLMHESVCKDGKGQTFICEMGPELQHHSNQRFFGGPKNMAGVFVRLERPQNPLQIRVNPDLKEIPVREGTMDVFDNLMLSEAQAFELYGVWEHAQKEKIPSFLITLSDSLPMSVGEFMSFWQHVALYSALLRGVDPYNQPEVEYAKKVSFSMLMKRKK